MGWLDALRNYYYKKSSRRNSWPITSRQRLEFNYYSKNNFGYASMWERVDDLPLQMRQLLDH